MTSLTTTPRQERLFLPHGGTSSTTDLATLLHQQQAVADLGQQALAGLPCQTLFERAVEAVSEGLGVEYAKVLELLPDGEALLLRAGVGWRPGLVGTATVGASLDSQAGYTLLSEHFVLVEDLATESRFNGPPLLFEHGVRSGASTVIAGSGRPFGVLGAHTRSRRTFTEADAQFLRSVANILGAAVERERADAALREREALLSLAQRLGRVGSYTFDAETGVTVWSEELYRIAGRDPSLPAADLSEYLAMLTPDSRQIVRENIKRYEADPHPFELEIELVRPDGEHRRIVQRGGLDPAVGRPNRIVGVLQDVTDERRMAAQLEEARRVEAIGRLAAGVAHDFNNLLTPIIGFSAACLDRLSADDPLRDDLMEIRKAGESAAELTRQLLAVGHRQLSQPEVVDLNRIVTQTARLLTRVLGAHIAIDLRLSATATIKADMGQITQILTNLAANARDAMPEGGTLTIETSNVVLDDAFSEAHAGIAPGPYVTMAVGDTGQGIPPEVLARVFEPFFTTKEFGKGTGLGLATVHGIVRQCHGVIDAESEPGRGTTLRLYFPAMAESATPDADRVAPEPATASGGGKKVLLVEDDEAVRHFARRVLLRHGYHVLDAATGEEALRLVAGGAPELDLLVTDVMMPGMNGPTLAERMTATNPHVRVLYMSGCTHDAIGDHGMLDPGVAFLSKPFTPDALALKVRHALR